MAKAAVGTPVHSVEGLCSVELAKAAVGFACSTLSSAPSSAVACWFDSPELSKASPGFISDVVQGLPCFWVQNVVLIDGFSGQGASLASVSSENQSHSVEDFMVIAVVSGCIPSKGCPSHTGIHVFCLHTQLLRAPLLVHGAFASHRMCTSSSAHGIRSIGGADRDAVQNFMVCSFHLIPNKWLRLVVYPCSTHRHGCTSCMHM